MLGCFWNVSEVMLACTLASAATNVVALSSKGDTERFWYVSLFSCMKELREGTYCFRLTRTARQALMNMTKCVVLPDHQ